MWKYQYFAICIHRTIAFQFSNPWLYKKEIIKYYLWFKKETKYFLVDGWVALIFIAREKWNNSIWIKDVARDIYYNDKYKKKTRTIDYDQSGLCKYLRVCL
jgi:hypothetical protein